MKDLRHALQHCLECKADLTCRDWIRVAKRVDVEVPVNRRIFVPRIVHDTFRG